MKYRHEWKHRISYGDVLALRVRLSAVMQPDVHAVDGHYTIRSLYFDSADDRALHEKLDGVNYREKFRIRYYNGDTSLLLLEKKQKLNGLCAKQSVPLSAAQVSALLRGDWEWMPRSGLPLATELFSKMRTQGLRPKTVVDYTREPFVFSAGNVRVTIDHHLRTGPQWADFLGADCLTLPVDDDFYLLEVKWDEFLPDIVRDAVQLSDCRVTAFSKYAACRFCG